jgi:peptidoglycan/LPS O-acetylase OafA/YrhL
MTLFGYGTRRAACAKRVPGPMLNVAPRLADPRVGYLDGWRGIAILLVLIGHFAPFNPFHLATLGVDFFFVLSGRLMAEILFVKRAALPAFFLRRFSRVYPGLLMFVIVAALLFHFTAIHVGVLGALSALTFTINYASLYVHPTGIFDHIWSLCVEEHSYLVLGALACLERRTDARAQLLILAIGICALVNGVIQSGILGRDYFQVYWRTDVQCAPIFLAAWFFLWSRQLHLIGQAVWLTPSCLALALLFKSALFGPTISYSVGTFFLSLSICFLDAAPHLIKRMLSVAPLRRIGIWSYSLYLWQQPFYKLKGTVPIYWLLPAVIVSGLLSFYLVEKPMRAFLNARINPPGMPAAQPS